jgi:AcrR family transcriptional regulator
LIITEDKTRVDPRVKRTRALVENAFLSLMAEKSFNTITVQEITDRAEINRATFYAHFIDKYDLFDHIITQSFRTELDKRTLSACHYSEGNLNALLMTVCDFVNQRIATCRTRDPQFESLVENQVKRQVQELLQAWYAEIGSPVDSMIHATAAAWAIYGLAVYWGRDEDHAPLEQYVIRIAPLIKNMLLPDVH